MDESSTNSPGRQNESRFMRLLYTIYVEPVMFIYMICLYYLIPVANSLYLYKVCRTVHGFDENVCASLVRANFTANMTDQENVVSTDTANWLFYQTVAFTIPSFIVTMVMGLYGDKYGRRIPLISPFVGQGLGCCYYLIMSWYKTIHVKYMLVGALITGISGGYACVIMACNSHISVMIPSKSRTVRLVVLQAVMGIGTVIGSFTVGAINSPHTDLRIGWVTTYAAIVGLSVIGIVYIVVRFWNIQYPSTYSSLGIENSLQNINIGKVFAVVCQNFPSVLQLVFLAIWLAWVEGLGEFDVLYSYAQRMKLNLSIYGFYNGFSAAFQAIAGAVAVLVFKGVFKMRDSYIAVIGLVSAALELLLLGISGFVGSNTTAFLFLWWASPVVAMFKITGPLALRSIAASLVLVTDQSKLFSFISATDALLQLATSALYNYLLWFYTEENIPSLSFFVSLVLILGSIAVTLIVERLLGQARFSRHEDDESVILSESDA